MAYSTKHNRMNQAGYNRARAQQNRELKAERERRRDPLRQTGRIESPMGRLMDLARFALPPGKRTSRTGNIYYERRENRSDRPPGRL